MSADDPFDLARFAHAQDSCVDQVLREIRGGRKASHWMWFIFPQFKGLGFSATSKLFAIGSLDEARAYLRHPILGPRLLECATAILQVHGRSVHDIFGSPDDLKLRSSMTLFAAVSGPDSVFHQVLTQYFDGVPGPATLRLIAGENT